jgi:hypothetical protein
MMSKGTRHDGGGDEPVDGRRLIGIWNADGTTVGELGYVLRKLTGRGGCALCDITHGWNPRGRADWRQACDAAGLEIQLLHSDEASARQLAATTGLPSILAWSDGTWAQVLSPGDLAGMESSPARLVAALTGAVPEPYGSAELR